MGGKCKKNRNWKAYNKELVHRGTFYIDPRFVEDWDRDVEELNQGKVGQPFLYPNSMFEFSAVFHARNFDYRTIEGILSQISEHSTGFSVPVYSQIRRRILKLKLKFSPQSTCGEIGIDGSGMKPTRSGDWIRHKWKVKRGWIKVVLMGNTEGDIIDIVVDDEVLNEQEVARQLLLQHEGEFSIVYLDGLHDTFETFEVCNKIKIDPVIRIRSNANSSGLTPRSKAVDFFQMLGYDKWRESTGYARRWLATEGIFSAEKRVFGESVSEKLVENQFLAVRQKYWAYQRIRHLAKGY